MSHDDREYCEITEAKETPGQKFAESLDISFESNASLAKAYDAATGPAIQAIKYKLGGGAVGDMEWRDALAKLEGK